MKARLKSIWSIERSWSVFSNCCCKKQMGEHKRFVEFMQKLKTNRIQLLFVGVNHGDPVEDVRCERHKE